MLTITQVHYIRELFYREGKSYSEIRRMTGKNYRTIKKYIEMQDFNEQPHNAQRPNKTDALRPMIHEWIVEDKSRHHKQRHTATRIYDRLRAEYPEILEVSARTVRNLVKEEKEKVYGAQKAHLLLQHPGGEAQVDFGTFEAYENDTLKKFHEFILSFPKSNAGFAVVTRSETREALLESLVTIFHYTGYVPQTLWFDQMASAALRMRDEQGILKAADFVQRFATHYGFTIKFCNPNSGHEKGNVENKVGTIRRNLFVPEPRIDNLETFNAELLEKCSLRHQQKHYRFNESIQTLFEQEQASMVPVNKVAFETARYESRKVNQYGLVEFSNCRYSATPQYVGQTVVLKIMANTIHILSKDLCKTIAKHPRLFTKGAESIHYIDFIDVIKARPNALKYSGIYTLLPPSWQDYLQKSDQDNFRNAFHVLKTILLEKDMDYADAVLQETKKHHALSPEALAVTFKRLKENRLIYDSSIDFPFDLPSYEVDASQYDELMGGGNQ